MTEQDVRSIANAITKTVITAIAIAFILGVLVGIVAS